MQSADNQTLKIISSIILVQGGILLYWIFTSDHFFSSIGFTSISNIGLYAWGVAALIVISYVWGQQVFLTYANICLISIS